MSRVLKSIVYLVVITGAGFFCIDVFSPTQKTKDEIKKLAGLSSRPNNFPKKE